MAAYIGDHGLYKDGKPIRVNQLPGTPATYVLGPAIRRMAARADVLWLLIDRLVLVPLERSTIERWGMVRRA